MKLVFKQFLLISVISLQFNSIIAQDGAWVPAKAGISTDWTGKVDPRNVLPEYPRPQLVRGNWQNLNGLWNYSITGLNENRKDIYNGKILVPFAVESSLSGVGKTIGKDSLLWYNRKFSLAGKQKGNRFLLHFGASDWKTQVFVNGNPVGIHEGGYDPFSFDITSYLNKGKEQDLTVSVWDPTDDGPQPRGKQVKKPEGIWYTPVTGIWQTVWLEAVPETYIQTLKPTPDIDRQILSIVTDVVNSKPGDNIKIAIWDGNTKINEQEFPVGENAILQVKDQKLWSPSSPFLYDLHVSVIRNGKAVDETKSYFAMRKSSIGKDSNGVKRMLLNNEFIFQYGPLDQGWWPDGLYTAPTDEALKFDIDKTKEMGFNMIRKHVKVEPARWYYHCDKEGMLVWQDMPSGDLGNDWNTRPGILGPGSERQRSQASENIYRKEWNAIMDALYPFPSIVVWTPFNEAWGQFKTIEIAEWTRKKDATRLVNSASGGNFYTVDHIMDIHNYPEPAMPDPELFGKKQALVLGEFGGLGLPVPGHMWQEKDNWGYQSFTSPEQLFKKYSAFMNEFPSFIKMGLSAAVYTQTTDVETESNGLMTYDRKVIKNAPAKLKTVHEKLYDKNLVPPGSH